MELMKRIVEDGGTGVAHRGDYLMTCLNQERDHVYFILIDSNFNYTNKKTRFEIKVNQI